MSIVLDTGAVVALYDADDRHHAAAREWLVETDEDLVTTPLCVSEMDHLVRRGGGAPAAERLWHDLDAGAIGVRWWAEGVSDMLRVARRHPYIGLADASLVALAAVLRTNRIATFDQHFRSIPTPDGEAFVVLPADR